MEIQAKLVGYNYFQNKEKTKMYHKLQFLYVEVDSTKVKTNASLIETFVDEKTYSHVVDTRAIFDNMRLNQRVNMQTSKVYYEVII